MSEAGVTTLAWVLKDRGGASHWSPSSSWDKVYPAPSKGKQEQIRGVSWNTLVLLALVCPSVLAAARVGVFFPEHSGPLLSPLPPGTAPEPMLAHCVLTHPFTAPHSESLGARAALLFSFTCHILRRTPCTCPGVNQIIRKGKQYLQKLGDPSSLPLSL